MARAISLRTSSTSSNVLAVRASAARDWMFWPTMMIGSSTSCRKLELIHKMSSCVLWMLSGRLINAMAANA